MKGQVAIPESSEELEELLHDDARMAEVMAAKDGMLKFNRAYMAAWRAKNTEAIRKMAEELQAGQQEFMREQADKFGARAPEGWRPGAAGVQGGQRRAAALAKSRLRDAGRVFDAQHLFNPKAIGAEVEDAGYDSSLREFVWATLKGEAVAARDGNSELAAKLVAMKARLADTLRVRNEGMSERIPAEGGFLVPENLRSEILALVLEQAVVRPHATVIPMDSLRVPIPTVDDTTHDGSVYGGVAGFWTAEGAALKDSAPSFDRILLIAAKLTGYTEIPNELLQDSVSAMDTWFRTFFPVALAFFEDLAFIMGNGVNQPLGVVNAPGAVTVTSDASEKISFNDTVQMFSRMWPGSLKNACWIAAPDTVPQLAQLGVIVTPDGGSATPLSPPVALPQMSAMNAPLGIEDGRNFTWMGRPGVISEKVPSLTGSKKGALALVDWSKYLIGDRQAMQIASSADYKFANDMVAYRVIERLDGRPWVQSAITPANGGPELSPYVLLDTTTAGHA